MTAVHHVALLCIVEEEEQDYRLRPATLVKQAQLMNALCAT